MKGLAAIGAAGVAVVLCLVLLVAAPPSAAPAVRGVPPVYAQLVEAAAATCPRLPAALLAAQLEQESAWNPRAVSPVGAQGLAQFMPTTWAVHGLDADGDGSADPFSPADAIWGAARYDCHLLDLLRDVPGAPLELMLAAYNAGPGRVLAARGVPAIVETQDYVRSVLSRFESLSVQQAAGGDGLTPRAAAVRQLVMDTFGVTEIGGFARSGHVEGSDHYTGRAIDVMLVPMSPEQTRRGWSIALFLQSNAQRLGITYLIWDARIWSVDRAQEGWRPYRHRSGSLSPTLQHLDHVHVSVR